MINTTFNWIDCIVFITMICFGSLIGIYMGCFHNKSKTAKEYLLGGKNMNVIPVAMSLEATYISGLTLLSLPAEAYRFGGTYILSCISMVLVVLITSYVYLPVLLKLNITSTYEYLERRFDLKTRQLASFFYGLSQFLYLPIVIYLPAIAFSSVTKVNFNYMIIIICAICILYTTIGGLKGVIWTDTLQLIVMIGSFTAILIAGAISYGGFTAVWNKAIEGQRLDIFNFSFDPTKRETVPIVIIGLTIHLLSYFGISQSFIQKLLALPSLKHAKRSLFLFLVMYFLLMVICIFTGFVIFAKYADCDPFKSKLIKKSDELVPFYVANIAVDIPGLSGLFLAGIFSGSLSTLSSDLNCVSGVFYEDCLLKLVKITQKWETFVLKIIVIISGIIIGILALLVDRFGGMWSLALSVMAMSTGPLLGMCTCGILLPKVHSRGAFYGALVATVTVGSIIAVTKYYESIGYTIPQETKQLSTINCHLYNISTPNEHYGFPDQSLQEKPFILFRITHYYYALIGSILTIVIGCIASYFIENNDTPVERNLLSPIIYSLLSPKSSNNNDETCSKLLNNGNQTPINIE